MPQWILFRDSVCVWDSGASRTEGVIFFLPSGFLHTLHYKFMSPSISSLLYHFIHFFLSSFYLNSFIPSMICFFVSTFAPSLNPTFVPSPHLPSLPSTFHLSLPSLLLHSSFPSFLPSQNYGREIRPTHYPLLLIFTTICKIVLGGCILYKPIVFPPLTINPYIF